MATNVYCDFCEIEVGNEDSFVVETGPIVRAYHYDCGLKISDACSKNLYSSTRARGRAVESNVTVVPENWEFRELKDRVDVLEDLTRRIASVWRLWLNDAGKGAINPGTFDAMRNLLGMDKA